MDKTTTYTLAEIMAAFDALKAQLDEECYPGAGDERYFIDDVATDIAQKLRGDSADERESDDDETLFVGQNYAYFRDVEEW